MRSRKRVSSWGHRELHSGDRARAPGAQRVSCCDWKGLDATNLVTKLVIAAFKLHIRDPNRDAPTQLAHPDINAVAHIRAECIRAVAEGADPKFLSESVLDAVDGVLETTIAMRVGRSVPRVVAVADRGGIPVTGTTGRGARLFALKPGRVLHVGMGRLELAWPGRKRERAIEGGHGERGRRRGVMCIGTCTVAIQPRTGDAGKFGKRVVWGLAGRRGDG